MPSGTAGAENDPDVVRPFGGERCEAFLAVEAGWTEAGFSPCETEIYVI